MVRDRKREIGKILAVLRENKYIPEELFEKITKLAGYHELYPETDVKLESWKCRNMIYELFLDYLNRNHKEWVRKVTDEGKITHSELFRFWVETEDENGRLFEFFEGAEEAVAFLLKNSTEWYPILEKFAEREYNIGILKKVSKKRPLLHSDKKTILEAVILEGEYDKGLLESFLKEFGDEETYVLFKESINVTGYNEVLKRLKKYGKIPVEYEEFLEFLIKSFKGEELRKLVERVYSTYSE